MMGAGYKQTEVGVIPEDWDALSPMTRVGQIERATQQRVMNLFQVRLCLRHMDETTGNRPAFFENRLMAIRQSTQAGRVCLI